MDRWNRPLLLLLAVGYLGLGLWQAFSPGSFTSSIGGFGVRNDHFVRDVSTWYVALGCGFLVALSVPVWRLPVLAMALIQDLLHLINHIADLGQASPGWAGPVDVASLSVVAAVIAALIAASLPPRSRPSVARLSAWRRC